MGIDLVAAHFTSEPIEIVDGKTGSGAQVDTDVAWVRFTGEGDECRRVRATDAGFGDAE